MTIPAWIWRASVARMVADSLAEKQALAGDVTVDRATDLLWALCSHDLYRMLVVEQHWPPEDYARWLAASLIHSLPKKHPTDDLERV